MAGKRESEKMNSMIRAATGRAPTAQEIHQARQVVSGVGGEVPAQATSLEILCRDRGALYPRQAAKLLADHVGDPEHGIAQLRANAPEMFARQKPAGTANAGESGPAPSYRSDFNLSKAIQERRNGGWGV